jgi:NADP-dependent 3-hydroxy acid dehydrogenase YdfG
LRKKKQSPLRGHRTAWAPPTSGFKAAAVYCATKFAVRTLAEGLRQEVKPYIGTTIISPGAVTTELLNQISDEDVRLANEPMSRGYGIPPESYARMVAFAISLPENVDVNELVFHPTAQELQSMQI